MTTKLNFFRGIKFHGRNDIFRGKFIIRVLSDLELSLLFKIDFQVFAEARRVVIARGLGVAERLE